MPPNPLDTPLDGSDGRPRITFAIPYHSNPDYLLEAVGSVRAQTMTGWELIVVDDAGPQPAGDLVAALGDRRISYRRNRTNLGLAGNWNECIRLAGAPWVTLLHADDRLAPGYAAAVVAAAAADPGLAAIFTDTLIIGADGRRVRSLPDMVKRLSRRPPVDHDVSGDAGLASILANNYVFCPTLCYRRSVVTGFDPRWRMVIDLDHTARLLLGGHRLRAIRRPLYEYRRHRLNQTVSLTASAVRFEEEIAIYRELAAAAESQGWHRSSRTARRRTMVRAHLAVQAAADLAGGRRDASRCKLALLSQDLRGRGQRDEL